MQDIDQVFQFIAEALSANAAKGQGSVVSIRVSPYTKAMKKSKAIESSITSDDVLTLHQVLKSFDGDFKKAFNIKK